MVSITAAHQRQYYLGQHGFEDRHHLVSRQDMYIRCRPAVVQRHGSRLCRQAKSLPLPVLFLFLTHAIFPGSATRSLPIRFVNLPFVKVNA